MCRRQTPTHTLTHLTRYELHVPSSKAAEFYESLTTAGREYETSVGVPVRPIGYRAIDSMSAEKGYRHWHADIGSGDTPMEAGVFFSSHFFFFPLIFRRFFLSFFRKNTPPPPPSHTHTHTVTRTIVCTLCTHICLTVCTLMFECIQSTVVQKKTRLCFFYIQIKHF
jgi:hypothetical protein